jgi:HrpA-like RNA helicase
VPQFLLDDPEIGPVCRIVVTQPRRLSAISVSERIAAERGEKIGGTIGYNIRLESEKSRSTQVIFVTPGVLLRKLQSDPTLEEFSHVIIDEAHERDRFTEFLLIVLRSVCAQRKGLKLLLMSATMQTTKLSSYFGNVPHIHIGGSVFPVQEFFLEHALRFTDYVGSTSSGGHGSSGDSALAAYMRSCQEYSCSLCLCGPFKSPEELGTHCALCTGAKQSIVHSSGSGKNYKARQYTSADELIRMLIAAAPVHQAKGLHNSRKPVSAGTLALNTASAAPTKKVEVADKEEEEDLWVDVESDEESSDKDDEDEDGAAGPTIVAVDMNQALGAAAEDDADGSEGLLKQYQYDFDDTQIDHNLIVSLLTYIFESEYCREGSVLVFLPGWDDISKMAHLLSAHPHFGNSRKYKIIQLHSGIPRKQQVGTVHCLQRNRERA